MAEKWVKTRFGWVLVRDRVQEEHMRFVRSVVYGVCGTIIIVVSAWCIYGWVK